VRPASRMPARRPVQSSWGVVEVRFLTSQLTKPIVEGRSCLIVLPERVVGAELADSRVRRGGEPVSRMGRTRGRSAERRHHG
jgi:hypothetical protein